MNRKERRAEKKRLGIRTPTDELRNTFRIAWTHVGKFAKEVNDAAMVRTLMEYHKWVRPHDPETEGLAEAYSKFLEWANASFADYEESVGVEDAIANT